METRSRTRGDFTSKALADFKYVKARFGGCNNAITTQTTAYSANADIVGTRRSMTDVVTKGFKRRSIKGEVILSPMSMVESTLNDMQVGPRLAYFSRTYQCTGGQKFQTHYDFPAWATWSSIEPDFYIGTDGHWVPPSDLVSAVEYEQAILEACTKAHAERGTAPVTFWETLAERKQTYSLMHEYFQQAKEITYRMERDVVKNRMPLPNKLFRAGGKIMKAAAATWLITRYGLLPVIDDIKKLRTQLGKEVDDAERHTARGKAVVGNASQSVMALSWDGDLNYSLTRYVTDEVTVRAMSLDEWKVSILDHYGLGSKELITLPWELLTLSFVGDWFVNMGDYLKAMIPTPTLKQLGSCYVATRARSLTSDMGNFSPVSPAILTSPGGIRKTATRVTKERIVGIRAPSLVLLNRNKIDPDLQKNTVRIVDASALIGQRLARVSSYLSKLPF